MGKLTVYSALNESTNNAFVDAFKKATPGVEVEVLPLAAAGELQTRIRTEKASPKADIFIGGSSEFHDPLGKQGLLEAVQVAQRRRRSMRPSRTPTAVDRLVHRHLRPGRQQGPLGQGDGRQAEAGNLGRPAHPMLKGKLDIPTRSRPAVATSSWRPRSSASNKDEAKALDYMKKLHANIGQYVGTSPQGIELVGQGQFLMVRTGATTSSPPPTRASRSSSMRRPTRPTRSARSASSKAARIPPPPKRSSTGC